MSQEYADMFRFEGSRTDKHVRDHEIYSVDLEGEVAADRPDDKSAPEMAEQVAEPGAGGWIQAARGAFMNASGQQRALYIGIFAGTLLLLVAIVFKAAHRPAGPLPQAAEAPGKPVAAQATTEVVAALPNTPEPVVERKPDEAPVAEKKQKAVQPAHGVHKQVPDVQEKAGKKPPSSIRTQEETAAAGPGAMALVSIAITPWGEVYLDGRMQGVSPPLTKLQVAPGKHEIEIRNTTFPAYTQSIQVKADEKIKIKHKFAN